MTTNHDSLPSDRSILLLACVGFLLILVSMIYSKRAADSLEFTPPTYTASSSWVYEAWLDESTGTMIYTAETVGDHGTRLKIRHQPSKGPVTVSLPQVALETIRVSSEITAATSGSHDETFSVEGLDMRRLGIFETH